MDKIDELLTRGVEQLITTKAELEKELRAGKKMRVYQGFDPTSPDLHIGHLVGLRKLRQWQDLGHEVIFLVGDFTAMIGDPTGKDQTRQVLAHEKTLENAKTFKEQAAKILRFTGENAAKILFNGDWLAKLSAIEVASLASLVTVPQLLERDMFQKRFKSGSDVAISEFLYPLLVAYDSVHLDVDVEVGGSDQFFNMMVGRDLMHKMKKKNKYVMSLRLLVDSNDKKMGKSEGNAIGLLTPPNQLFGLIMTLGDDTIVNCFEQITTVSLERVAEIKKRFESGENPMNLKKELAFQIVAELHTENDAKNAQLAFETTFQKGELASADIPTHPVPKSDLPVEELLVITKLVDSKSEAKRLVDQNAVEINDETISSRGVVKINSGDIIKVGKRKFLKFI